MVIFFIFRTTGLPGSVQSNISVSIQHLLLEASRIKDESERKYNEAEKNAKTGDLEMFLQKLLSELNSCDGLCCLDAKSDEIISLANADKYGLDKLTREMSKTDSEDGKSFSGDIFIHPPFLGRMKIFHGIRNFIFHFIYL